MNHYWGRAGKSRYIGAKGKAYWLETRRHGTALRVTGFRHARLHVARAVPPDRRARTGQPGEVSHRRADARAAYADDSQIDRLPIERGEVRRMPGCW